MGYDAVKGSSWTKARRGVFELNDEFYKTSRGIFEKVPHYEAMFDSNNR